MKKRIFSVLVALAVGVGLCSVCSMMAFADAGVLTSTLTFTSTTASTTGEGYKWDKDTKTLTITEDGLSITTSSGNGITLPANSKIIINGELNITPKKYAIDCAGDLTIEANAATNITSSGYEAIRVYNGGSLELTVAENVGMNVSGYNALYASSDVAVTVYGTLNLNLSGSSSYKFGAESYSGAVTINGTGTIYSYGSSTSISAGDSIALGTDDSDTFTLTLGSAISSSNSSNLLIADKVTINGLIKYTDQDIVYGAYTATYSELSSGTGKTLVLSDNATLTVDKSVNIDLSSYTTVTSGTGAQIINNGSLKLASADVIKDLNITGDGEIFVEQDDGLYAYYNNDGTLLYYDGTFALDRQAVTSDFYSWTNDRNTYTLTLFSGVDYTNIHFKIEVSDVIFNLTDDVTVKTISFSDVAAGTKLTITGDYTLTCEYIYGEGTLTIAQGAMLVAQSIYYNNGYSAMDIDWDTITGDGLLQLGDDCYDTDGNKVTVLNTDIDLYADEVTAADDAGYTWLCEDGTYTLTFDEGVDAQNVSIYIEISNNVIFNVPNDITVDCVYYKAEYSADDTADDIVELDEEDGAYTMTISGDGTLTATLIEFGRSSYEYGMLTIDCDVVADEGIESYVDMTINGNVVAGEGVGTLGDLTINGDVVGETVLAFGNMTIDGTVVVDEVEGTVYVEGDMTITGDVTAAYLGSEGDMTINGTVSTAVMICCNEMTVGSEATVVVSTFVLVEGVATISGDFTAALLVVTDALTINDGATVTLTGIGMQDFLIDGCTVALAVGSEDSAEVAPLTLGDNISVLTPEDGTYKGIAIEAKDRDGVPYTYYFGSIFTGDSDADADWSNVAGSIVFGDPNAVADTDTDDDSSSSSTSSSVTVTTDDTEATYTTEDSTSTTAGTSSSSTSTGDAADEADEATGDSATTTDSSAADTATSGDAADAASDDTAEDAETANIEDEEVPLAQGSSTASSAGGTAAAAAAGFAAIAIIGGGAWYYFGVKRGQVD